MTARSARHLSLVPAGPGDDPEPDQPGPGEQDDRPLPEVRAATGFAWTCRKAVVENRKVVEEHHITSSDRGEYERHMRSHALVAPLKSAYRPWKPWRAPRPAKPHVPKPMDAGQRVEWLQIIDGHWEGATWVEASDARPGHFEGGTWIEKTSQTRTGTVWSPADTASSWWVQPDDDPARPVCVRRAGKRDYGYAEGDLFEIPQAGEAARASIIRGNLIRKRGIFPVIDSQTYWDRANHVYVHWHTDKACPRAEGKERYDPAAPPDGFVYGYQPDDYGQPPWTPLTIAAALAKNGQPPSEFCPDCISGLDIAVPAVAGPVPGPATARQETRSPEDPDITDDGRPAPESGTTTVANEHPSEPEPAGRPAAASVPRGCRRPARFALRLEPPAATDEDFLESCAAISTALTALAGQLAAWADGLRSLHFPASVLGLIDQAAGSVIGAAGGAAQAASAFEDEFSDARDIASRGMHITGQHTA